MTALTQYFYFADATTKSFMLQMRLQSLARRVGQGVQRLPRHKAAAAGDRRSPHDHFVKKSYQFFTDATLK